MKVRNIIMALNIALFAGSVKPSFGMFHGFKPSSVRQAFLNNIPSPRKHASDPAVISCDLTRMRNASLNLRAELSGIQPKTLNYNSDENMIQRLQNKVAFINKNLALMEVKTPLEKHFHTVALDNINVLGQIVYNPKLFETEKPFKRFTTPKNHFFSALTEKYATIVQPFVSYNYKKYQIKKMQNSSTQIVQASNALYSLKKN